jgi:uncharacterized protein (DUF2164 family)
MAEITLTEEQIAKILQDMQVQTHMLTDEEVNALANKVNAEINLPFLSEEKEGIVFFKIIKWIDRQLYALLPNEYYSMVHDMHDGVSPEEIVKIRQRVVPLINDVVNIPILPEKLEGVFIGVVVDLILSAMVKGFNLEERPLKK